MKRTLLMFGVGLSACVSLSAQAQKKARNIITTQHAEQQMLENEITSTAKNLQPSVNNPNKVMAIPYKRMASSINAFTLATFYTRNFLTYNKNINAVVFTHRKSVEWKRPGTDVAQGGLVQATWTTNNGTSFDSTIVYTDTIRMGRYPAAALYNPSGNTNVANAKLVFAGNAVVGTAFGATYYGSATLATGAVATNNSFWFNYNAPYTTGGNSLGGRFNFPGSNMQEAGGNIWTISNLHAGDMTSTTANVLKRIGMAPIKVSTADNGGTFTWKLDSIKPAYMNRTDGSAIMWGDPLIAFSPNNPQIGYAVECGVEAGATGSRKAYQPVVYKTTNGGGSWERVNAAYDWAAGNNKCLMSTITEPVKNNPTLFKPWFSSDFGWDATVDNQDRLHLICTVTSGTNDELDSLANRSEYNYHGVFPRVWDLVTKGDGNWNEYFVDILTTKDLNATQNENPWKTTSNGPKLAYDNRLQVSRTTDGSRIFVGWIDTDTIATGDIYNSQPDLNIKAINATNMNMSNRKVISPSMGEAFFMIMSDITIEKTPGNYQIPMTITSSPLLDADKPVNHYYVDNATITDADINITYNCSFIGIKESVGAIEAVAQNFPNPFDNSTTINVTLSTSENIQLSVYNTMGELVSYKAVKGNAGDNNITVDGTNLSNGVYFYTVNVNGDVVTKKMIVRK